MQGQSKIEPIIRMRDAAETLGVSVSGLRNMIARGDGPPAVRIGNLIGFRRDALEQWIRSREIPRQRELTAA
jgi:excisionase family DNA binding protein